MPVLCGLHGTDVDEKNAAKHHQSIWHTDGLSPLFENAIGGDELNGEDDGKDPINSR